MPRVKNPLRTLAKDKLRRNPNQTARKAVEEAASELDLEVSKRAKYGPTVLADVNTSNLGIALDINAEAPVAGLVDAATAEKVDLKGLLARFEGVQFASQAAADAALEAGLTAEDLQEDPTGETGFTKADVEAAIKAKKEAEGEEDEGEEE